ncbi:Protein ERGIC-53 [Chytriomyces hyalinus]|nr:Protein ERGIC-53 [Chytriomyces hyalinus]
MQILLALSLVVLLVLAEPRTRYDYRQSLKRPFVPGPGLKTDSKQSVLLPNFNPVGNSVVASDRIRLAPSVADASGGVWCTQPNPHNEWMVRFSFASTSHGGTHGLAAGRGFAFWYAKDPSIQGALYGAGSMWNGLLVGLDTSSPETNRHSPLIYAIKNDGYTTLDTPNAPPENQNFLGKCFRDYVNAPHNVFGRITYAGRTLKVEIDLTQGGFGFTECFRADNVVLPRGYHFGFTAATSAKAQADHDLFAFEVFEVNPSGGKGQSDHNGMPENKDELQKIKDAEAAVLAAEGWEYEEVLPVGFQEAFSPEVLRNLEDNQEKIITAINLLQEKVGLIPIQAARTVNARYDKNALIHMNPLDFKVRGVSGKVDVMLSLTTTLSEDIRQLTTKIKLANDLGDASLGAIGKLLGETERKMDSTAQLSAQKGASGGGGGNGKTSMMEYCLFLMIGGVFVWVVSALARMGKSSGSSSVSLGRY